MNNPLEIRETCWRCNKVAYRVATFANAAAVRLRNTHGRNLRVYYDEVCFSYHLTSQPHRHRRPYGHTGPRRTAERPAARRERDRQAEEDRRTEEYTRAARKVIAIALCLPLVLSYLLFRKSGMSKPTSYVFTFFVALLMIEAAAALAFDALPVRTALQGFLSVLSGIFG